MSTPVFHRRRAARLAVLLDEATRGRSHHRRTDVDGELGDLVRLAGRVGQLTPTPVPDTEFRDSLRAMLMARIERDGIGVTATQRADEAAVRAALAGETQVVRSVPAGGGRARAAVLAGFTAGALALSGVSAASTDALPGDALYQVKRSSERAQLALAGSAESRGQLHLEFATARLREAARVGQGQDITALLDDMDAATLDGVVQLSLVAVERRETAMLDSVLDFVNRQRGDLNVLARSAADAPAVQQSRHQLDTVEQRAKELKAALGRTCLMKQKDELGPKPC